MRLIWLLLAIVLLLPAGIAAHLSPLRPSALALPFAYMPRSFGAIVHPWPAEDLQGHRHHFVADYALLVGTFAVAVAYGWLTSEA